MKALIFLAVLLLGIGWAVLSSPAESKNIPDQPKYFRYVVEPGDTLWRMADKYYPGVDKRKAVWMIRSLNKLDKGKMLQPGQEIWLPVGGVKSKE